MEYFYDSEGDLTRRAVPLLGTTVPPDESEAGHQVADSREEVQSHERVADVTEVDQTLGRVEEQCCVHTPAQRVEQRRYTIHQPGPRRDVPLKTPQRINVVRLAHGWAIPVLRGPLSCMF